MTAISLRSAAKAAAILCLVGISYAAGTASAGPDTVTRLNLAIDALTKAKALLGAAGPSTRAGAAHTTAAKAAVDNALDLTQKAVKAEGG